MEQKKPTPRPAAKPAGKPAKKPAGAKPGDGLFGWIGRQVGNVKKAVQTDVTKPGGKAPGKKPATAAKKPASGKPSDTTKTSPRPAAPTATADTTSLSEKVIFRQDKVEEAEMPHQPGVILRRTIIDEVVVERESIEDEKK